MFFDHNNLPATKFESLSRNGDIGNARKYYFNGLRKVFDGYINNSINSFKEFEDKYTMGGSKNCNF